MLNNIREFSLRLKAGVRAAVNNIRKQKLQWKFVPLQFSTHFSMP